MTPEEFNRIKEAEKEHLRALKKLKAELRKVQQQRKVAEALKEIQNAPGDDISQTHEEMIDRLAMDTIREEVRLEMALSEVEGEGTEAEQSVIGESEEERQKKILQSDAELKKLRAQELVRQIKLQMGLADLKRKLDDSSAVSHDDAVRSENRHESKEDGKTLDSTSPVELPEKTIGRVHRKKS